MVNATLDPSLATGTLVLKWSTSTCVLCQYQVDVLQTKQALSPNSHEPGTLMYQVVVVHMYGTTSSDVLGNICPECSAKIDPFYNVETLRAILYLQIGDETRCGLS